MARHRRGNGRLLALPQSVLTRINTILYRFLWKRKYNNKRAFGKIKRNVLSLDIEEGGMKMITTVNQQQQNCKHTQCTERHRRHKTQPGQKQNRIPLLARSNKTNNTDEQKQRTCHGQY